MRLYQANLLQVENILNYLPYESIKSNKEAISLGLELLSIDGFAHLFDESYKKQSREYLFSTLKAGLVSKGKQISASSLLYFLQNPLFCGKEIAYYFQSYQLPDSLFKEETDFSQAITSSPAVNFPSELSTSSPPLKKLKSNITDFDKEFLESAAPIQTQSIASQGDEEIPSKISETHTKFTSDFFKVAMSQQKSDDTEELKKLSQDNAFTNS